MKEVDIIHKKNLLIGIGNIARSDDGLGWLFAQKTEKELLERVDVEYRHQLQVEDAGVISEYDRVFFVDASTLVMEEGFSIEQMASTEKKILSSHALSPAAVISLAETLYRHKPVAFVIAISGYNWGFGSQLSIAANENIEKAYKSFLEKFFQ